MNVSCRGERRSRGTVTFARSFIAAASLALVCAVVATGQATAAAPSVDSASPAGAFALFDIPEASSSPESIALGVDGNMWYTERVGNRISRITPSGMISEFRIPTASSLPFRER